MTCNFSLQYIYIILQNINENTETYLVEAVIFIKCKILETNLEENAQKLKEKINNQIWRVKSEQFLCQNHDLFSTKVWGQGLVPRTPQEIKW